MGVDGKEVAIFWNGFDRVGWVPMMDKEREELGMKKGQNV